MHPPVEKVVDIRDYRREGDGQPETEMPPVETIQQAVHQIAYHLLKALQYAEQLPH